MFLKSRILEFYKQIAKHRSVLGVTNYLIVRLPLLLRICGLLTLNVFITGQMYDSQWNHKQWVNCTFQFIYPLKKRISKQDLIYINKMKYN